LIWGFQTNLTELKAFPSPPPAVVNVMAAVSVLYSCYNEKQVIPKDRSWKETKKMMTKVLRMIIVSMML